MKAPTSTMTTQLLVGLLAAGVWTVALQNFAGDANAADAGETDKRTIGELTVERINVVDRNGKPRLVIANAERFPAPTVRGKEYPRSIQQTAGMIFFDTNGEETGGLVTSGGNDGDARSNAFGFDYNIQPTDGIGMIKRESNDGKSYLAGISVADRLPYAPGEIKTTGGVSRLWVGNKNQDAALELSDTRGNTRIRIAVGKDDQPVFEVLDAEGKVVKRLLSAE